MRQDKEYIFSLRKQGKSYRAIQRETGVSRATLTKWFENQEWSKHLQIRNAGGDMDATRERLHRMNMVRNLKLQYQYALIEKRAKEEYQNYRKEPLFWAGITTYMAHGDRTTSGVVRISSSEPAMHRIFIKFLELFGEIETSRCTYSIVTTGQADQHLVKEYWVRELGLPTQNGPKVHILKGKSARSRLQFGVGTTILSSTELKKKILTWVALVQSEQFG